MNGKHGIKYAGPEIELMKKIAAAHKEKSLLEFQKVLNEEQLNIQKDKILSGHINNLYEN